jgi:hypothetical protein
MDEMILGDQVLRLLEIEDSLSPCLAGKLRHGDRHIVGMASKRRHIRQTTRRKFLFSRQKSAGGPRYRDWSSMLLDLGD